MRRHVWIAIWLVGTAPLLVGQTQSKPAATGPVLDAKHPVMQIEQFPLSGTTTLFGEPSKEGLYMVRTQLAANTKVRPRFYDQARLVTVLKGTWWVGQGDVFRADKFSPVREGGVMYMPANTKHYEFAGSGDVILQIVGNGPAKETHAEVDVNGQPVPVGGPYPEDNVEGSGRGRRGRRGAPPPPPVDPDQTPPTNPALLPPK